MYTQSPSPPSQNEYSITTGINFRCTHNHSWIIGLFEQLQLCKLLYKAFNKWMGFYTSMNQTNKRALHIHSVRRQYHRHQHREQQRRWRRRKHNTTNSPLAHKYPLISICKRSIDVTVVKNTQTHICILNSFLSLFLFIPKKNFIPKKSTGVAYVL